MPRCPGVVPAQCKLGFSNGRGIYRMCMFLLEWRIDGGRDLNSGFFLCLSVGLSSYLTMASALLFADIAGLGCGEAELMRQRDGMDAINEIQ